MNHNWVDPKTSLDAKQNIFKTHQRVLG